MLGTDGLHDHTYCMILTETYSMILLRCRIKALTLDSYLFEVCETIVSEAEAYRFMV